MDNFLIEFSLENAEAAIYEFMAVGKSAGDFTTQYLADNYAIVKGDISRIRECSFVNFISEIKEESDDHRNFSGKGLPGGTFYVRVRDFNGCHDANAEPEIGEAIRGGRRVSFKDPAFRVRAVHGSTWYLTVVIYEKDRKSLEARRAPLRPFFSPIAIHPKYARYLVNTTETGPGDLILDPFCGTGGILLEAGIMGRRIIGNDFSLNMVKGARLNLKYFSLKNYAILNKDVADLDLDQKVDGIATDLPYGRNSNMKAESVKSLYMTAFTKFHEWMRPGGIAAIVLSERDLLGYAEDMFEIIKVVEVPQHRSLTRYFVAMRRLDT